jgi:4-amino-4-deoxy-L-arabinose transferase-like glycosyltransferase
LFPLAWVAAAILFFLRALEIDEETEPHGAQAVGSTTHARSRLWWGAALLCVAGGVLTKWTAPVFFYGTVVPLLWWRGRLRLLWSRQHLLGAILAAGVCLAWAGAAVALAGWDAFFDTVSREAMQRLSPSHHQEALRQMHADQPAQLYPWAEALVHPLKILAINLPWSAFALLTLRPRFAQLWDERGRRLLQALHCWTWPNLLFWTLVPEHGSRHSFPLFPGLAGLAALVWVAWLTGRLRWPVPRVRAGQVLVGILAVWLAAKLLFVHAVVPARSQKREPRAKAEQLAAVVPEGKTLYLFRQKDEAILFYFGREVRLLPDVAQLPSHGEPVYCMLDQPDWLRWPSTRPAEVLLHLRDELGAPMVLVRVRGEP